MYIPDNINQKLELNIILNEFQCVFNTTKHRFFNDICLSINDYKIQSQNIIYYREFVENHCNIRDFHLFDFDNIIDRIISKEPININNLFVLRNAIDFLFTIIKTDKQFIYKLSFDFNMDIIKDINKLLNRIIDKNGELKDDASEQLKYINKQLNTLKNSENKIVKSVIKKYYDKLMNENITLFDNRIVIQVKVMYKNEINGILHDYSNTEKTAFMEPEEFIDYNNKLRALIIEKQEEIKSILLRTKNILNNYKHELLQLKECLILIDKYNAISIFMDSYNAYFPKIGDKFDLKKAYNPILYKIKKDKTIPFDLSLDKNRSLLITGPNMGGKTVLLKTLGLFQLMIHKGLPLTLDKNSVIPFYENIFVDIGDDQSVESGISTFASHLINYKKIIDNVNNKTIVLLDEIGTGTNVKEGSAFAISLIEYLINKDAMIVFTSHFDDIKEYAINSENINYASMAYDLSKNKPIYKLIMNSMGISGVVNLIKEYDFPDEIIKKTKNLMGKEFGNYNTLIEKYKRKLSELNKQEKYIKQQMKIIEQLKQYYEKYQIDYKNINKKLQKEYEDRINDELLLLRKESELLIKKIKESKADKYSIKQLKNFINKNLKQQKQIYNKKNIDVNIGDLVEIEGNIKGIVEDIRQKKIIIDINGIKIETDKNSIIKRHEADKWGKDKNVIINSDFDIKYSIDLRGMYVEDAIMELEVFIQNAISGGLKQIKIIHGHGTGALKGAIREYLKQMNNIEFESGDSFQGGDGVTIVRLHYN